MPALEDAGGVTWLVLVYQLPAKPGGLKTLVPRKLTAAGAVYLSRACAVAPAAMGAPTERAMRRVRAMIADAGGTAVLLRAGALGGEELIIGALETARDREYDDITVGCRDGLASIGALIEAGDFRYEQLWEIDRRLKRLDARYRTVGTRGTAEAAGAGKARGAASALATCRAALDGYASSVYATDSAS
jgi:ChrB-like protein